MTETTNNKYIAEFTQKRGLNIRKFCLYQNKLVIETKTIRKIEKYEVNIEKLGSDLLYQADNVIIGKIWFYVCLVCPIFSYVLQLFPSQKLPITNLIIIHAGCWLFALSNFLKQHQDDIILKGQADLEFYRDIPNEQSVLDFIELIKATTKNQLKRKYFNIDNYIDESEFNRTMNSMLDRNIISKSEFKNILRDYKLKNL